MLDPAQFVEHIVVPALEAVRADSKAARQLLLGTALQESGLRYVAQLGGGPARGFFQMEPATHDDIWDNYLAGRPGLARRVQLLVTVPADYMLAGNALYAAAMCRVHYLRRPEALPAADDIGAHAWYWKQFYNTPRGAGTEEEYLENWSRFGAGVVV